MKELKEIADAYQGKVKLCNKEIKKVELEEAQDKQLDLKTKTDEGNLWGRMLKTGQILFWELRKLMCLSK